MVWIGGEHCKTVGSAYVGSNPTPATPWENGPLAAETRPGGPFSSCHHVYQHVSLRVDAWQWLRTYGVQRPGGTSGPHNRSLCQSASVLSSYSAPDCSPDWGMPRIPVGRCFAVLLAPGGGLASFIPAPRAGGLPDRPAPSHRGSTEEMTRRHGEPRRQQQKVPGVPGRGLDPAEPVMYLSWADHVPVMYLSCTCAGDAPDHECQRRCPLVAAVGEVPDRLA